MKYGIDAYKGGAVKQGTKLLDNIDEAIKLAYAVANHYKCYTRVLSIGYSVSGIEYLHRLRTNPIQLRLPRIRGKP